jgi:hypothetical protein
MATRYSGEAVVRVTWVDTTKTSCPHGGHYRATVSVRGRNLWSGTICAPQHLTMGVDSPEAYDDTARAALAFAEDDVGSEVGDHVAFDADLTDRWVGRSPRDAWDGRGRQRGDRRRPSQCRSASGRFTRCARR